MSGLGTDLVPTDLGLCRQLVVQRRVDEGVARSAFPGVDLAVLPADFELFLLTLGEGSVLVAHHGAGGSEVWEAWRPGVIETPWVRLNGRGGLPAPREVTP